MSILLILIFVFCLAVSFLMSGMEAGVFVLSRLRVRQQARTGNRRAAVLLGYLERPENFLWTILVGNTVANFTAACLGFFGLVYLLSGWPVFFWSGYLVGGMLFYVGCEWLPKVLFRLYPNRFCMAVAPSFGLVAWIFRPLVSLMALFARSLLRWTGGKRFTGHLFGNRDELRVLMKESAQSLSSAERSMIERVMDLQNLSVRQIAVPWAKVLGVASQTSVKDLLAFCREQGISRLPVWNSENSPRRVAGLIDLKTVLFRVDFDPSKPVSEFLKPALFLEEDLRLEVALRQMQRSGQRLAIILGRDYRELGVLSLEDILSVIFGEVRL